MHLGERLKLLREKEGYSQEELATILNLKRQSISKWEVGGGYPDIENLIKLSELYEVSLDELIKGDRDFQKNIKVNEANPNDFIALFKQFWWLIFPIYGMIMGLLGALK